MLTRFAPINVPTFTHGSDGEPLHTIFERDQIVYVSESDIKTQLKHFPDSLGLRRCMSAFKSNGFKKGIHVRMT